MLRHPALLPSLVLACLCVGGTWGHPSGAPSSACINMTPNHGSAVTDSTTKAKYTVTATKTEERKYTVRVVASAGAEFRGVLLQARSGDTIVGTMTPKDTNMFQALTCGSVTNSAMTHKTRDDKSSAEAEWTPADDFSGDVEFYATVVIVYADSIKGIKSEKITISDTPIATTTTTTPSPSTSNSVTISEAPNSGSTTPMPSTMASSTQPANTAAPRVMGGLLVTLVTTVVYFLL